MKKLIYIFTIFSLVQISAQQKVGINKDQNLRAEVDVNGTVSIENTPLTKDNNFLPLYIDTREDSRRLAVYGGDAKPFTIIEVKIEPPYDSDYVYDFDTKIPTDEYQIFLSDAYFANHKWEENISTFPSPISYGIAHTYKNGQSSGAVYNVEKKVSLFEKNGTWHIAADYYGAVPVCKNTADPSEECKYYFWDITLLAIDKSFVEQLGIYSTTDDANNVNILEHLAN